MRSDRLEAGLAAAARAVAEMIRRGQLTGVVLAAADGEGGFAVRAEGADRTGRRLSEDDRFLTTSVTKMITAVQIMRLVDRGDLDLREPVIDLIPEFDGPGKRAVQVHHLLSHSSGLSLRANVVEGPPTDLDAAELEAYAIAAPLSRAPGTGVEYCSPAFWVLSALLRRRVGHDHVTDLQVLARQLGLAEEELGYDVTSAPARLVDPVVRMNRHLPDQVRRVAYPAGGVVATGHGLARLGSGLLAATGSGGRILSHAAVEAMTRTWSSGDWPDGRRAEWGLGVELDGPGDLMSRRTMFHFGASGVAMWVDVERSVTLVALTADWYASRSLFARLSNAFSAVPSCHGDSMDRERVAMVPDTDRRRSHD